MPTEPTPKPSGWSLPEDIIAILAGGVILCGLLLVTSGVLTGSDSVSQRKWFAKPGGWKAAPVDAFVAEKASDDPKWKPAEWPGVLTAIGVLAVVFGFVSLALADRPRIGGFVAGFLLLGGLATFAYLLAGQSVIKAYNLEYALWALLVGLIVGNTVGKSGLGPAATAIRTELYIKTGLVLLGAEVLFGRLLELGPPGILVSWVVTPIVLVTTFWFGQKILKIASPSLNMTISADMSVCGVSAAIATGAACKATREELSAAIGLSLCFTAGMMVVMPLAVEALDLGPIVGGAWLGGTIDATGAVAVAGAALGDEALEVATVVKMIQNILIGVVAFAVAAYWTIREERSATDLSPETPETPQTPETPRRSKLPLGEIWKRFPKFILGFLAASVIFSILYASGSDGQSLTKATIGNSKVLRGWLFCLAFVCIGIDLNFRELRRQFVGGKPLLLYLCGQSLNILLTLAMATFAFRVAFPID